jgi:uncharacterized membrane protein
MMDEILIKNLSVGVILLVVFSLWLLFPPKSINMIYGYRTSKSMKNKENWKFANHFFPKWGILLASCSIICGLFFYLFIDKNSEIFTLVLTLLGFIPLFLATERKMN